MEYNQKNEKPFFRVVQKLAVAGLVLTIGVLIIVRALGVPVAMRAAITVITVLVGVIIAAQGLAMISKAVK